MYRLFKIGRQSIINRSWQETDNAGVYATQQIYQSNTVTVCLHCVACLYDMSEMSEIVKKTFCKNTFYQPTDKIGISMCLLDKLTEMLAETGLCRKE